MLNAKVLKAVKAVDASLTTNNFDWWHLYYQGSPDTYDITATDIEIDIYIAGKK
ncbi:hypothetical protein SKUN_00627 [Spiroplasma kunkelii CR2-3x]|uniref:Uncharacterized protein n=1 Tax=Spiroplasma kunkelii CR2-3x TaxID=273035 RepID=A0A0K2JFZ7_SPIKU|nr:hypothetical protein [Spiroplasma kunkelii]ALA97520.1 hypothetical protein SKUN_00627 [Spiroplasma kunkelii CR2-3x]